MKVKRNTLLLLACIVWSVAGGNILRIGLASYEPYMALVNFFLTLVVLSFSRSSFSASWWTSIRIESADTKRNTTSS